MVPVSSGSFSVRWSFCGRSGREIARNFSPWACRSFRSSCRTVETAGSTAATVGGVLLIADTDSHSLAAYSASSMSLGSRSITCCLMASLRPLTKRANISVCDFPNWTICCRMAAAHASTDSVGPCCRLWSCFSLSQVPVFTYLALKASYAPSRLSLWWVVASSVSFSGSASNQTSAGPVSESLKASLA